MVKLVIKSIEENHENPNIKTQILKTLRILSSYIILNRKIDLIDQEISSTKCMLFLTLIHLTVTFFGIALSTQIDYTSVDPAEEIGTSSNNSKSTEINTHDTNTADDLMTNENTTPNDTPISDSNTTDRTTLSKSNLASNPYFTSVLKIIIGFSKRFYKTISIQLFSSILISCAIQKDIKTLLMIQQGTLLLFPVALLINHFDIFEIEIVFGLFMAYSVQSMAKKLVLKERSFKNYMIRMIFSIANLAVFFVLRSSVLKDI